MKTAFLNFKQCLDNKPTDENFTNVAINSGNIVFSYSIKETIKCESVILSDLRERADEFDSLVVRDFITIREDMV